MFTNIVVLTIGYLESLNRFAEYTVDSEKKSLSNFHLVASQSSYFDKLS